MNQVLCSELSPIYMILSSQHYLGHHSLDKGNSTLEKLNNMSHIIPPSVPDSHCPHLGTMSLLVPASSPLTPLCPIIVLQIHRSSFLHASAWLEMTHTDFLPMQVLLISSCFCSVFTSSLKDQDSSPSQDESFSPLFS